MLQTITTAIAAAAGAAWGARTVSDRTMAAVQDGSWLAAAALMAAAVAALGALVTLVGLVLIYAERKIAGHFQCRLGPMRVGPHGIFQTVADTFKLLLKEESSVPLGED